MASSSTPPWADLLPEVLDEIITHHLYPADVARFRAVCRTWHSAARQQHDDLQHDELQLPWIVIPNGSFCTIGDGGALFNRISSLPDNVTCLGGAAADGWLALDVTGDVFRRTNHWDTYHDSKWLEPRPDVKHKHAYLLHNPFSGKSVPLPELDSLVGHVAETFEIRKVLMRSAGSPDDLVVVTTNNRNYSIILCRPGKGRFVFPYLRIFDVAFFRDKLYGITPEEDLVAFDLAEDDDDGSLIVKKPKRVIRHPLADGEDDPWSWMDDDSDDDGGGNEAEPDDDGQGEEDSFNVDDDNGTVPDGNVIVEDEEVPYEPKDYIRTSRCIVESCGGKELLMVRRQVQSPQFNPAYTRKVEIFRADIDKGEWVPVTGGDALAEGEALFLSRSFSNSTRVYGELEEGLIYFVDMNQVFDTRSSSCRPFSIPWQRNRAARELLTWCFPPKLVV
ncbi:unnamed protein product [Urochloa decumbens]|uniref:KIB1-4 beta-propeller domain-containing protein n=1 Tax=Urochloa decumbens TaxID=240449 RepID=A0ABC9BVN9_9POAL